MNIMGHSDIQTTMNIYAEATGVKKQESMMALSDKFLVLTLKALYNQGCTTTKTKYLLCV